MKIIQYLPHDNGLNEYITVCKYVQAYTYAHSWSSLFADSVFANLPTHYSVSVIRKLLLMAP